MVVPVPSNYPSDPEVSLGFLADPQRKEFTAFPCVIFCRRFLEGAGNTAAGHWPGMVSYQQGRGWEVTFGDSV